MSDWDNTTLFVDDDPADRAFRQEVREWVAQNLPAELCNRPTRIDPPELKPWHRKLYERGWIAPHWPKQYGGMGATLTQQIILFEEISRVGAPTPYPHGLELHRAADHRCRDARAEGPAPAADPDRRRDLVPGLFGDRRRIGPRQPDHARRARRRQLHRQRPQDLDDQRPLRRLDVRAGAYRPEGAAAPCRHQHAADRPEVARRHRQADPDHQGRRRIRRGVCSRTCGCRARTCSARSTKAGASPTTCSAPSASPPAIRATPRSISTGRGKWPSSPARSAKPFFLQRLAALEIDLLAFSAYYRHAATLHGARPGAALDGAGDQDRRRRAGSARLGALGRRRRADSVRRSTT